VFFGFNSSALTDAGWDALHTTAMCLRHAPHTKLYLEGHCDLRGTEEYNLGLAAERLASVLSALQSLGVASREVVAVPKGKSEATCLDDAEWCHANNRRVEIGVAP
jgi:peptidoglycan-associated lipoprotein